MWRRVVKAAFRSLQFSLDKSNLVAESRLDKRNVLGSEIQDRHFECSADPIWGVTLHSIGHVRLPFDLRLVARVGWAFVEYEFPGSEQPCDGQIALGDLDLELQFMGSKEYSTKHKTETQFVDAVFNDGDAAMVGMWKLNRQRRVKGRRDQP